MNGKLYDETSQQCVDASQCPGYTVIASVIVNILLIVCLCIEPDRCTLPRVVGPCLGNIKRYYYNGETGKCEVFRYGGCIGNKNNFFTLHECELACSGTGYMNY